MAIAHEARRPRADYPPMRIVHFSGKAFSYGVEEKKLPAALFTDGAERIQEYERVDSPKDENRVPDAAIKFPDAKLECSD